MSNIRSGVIEVCVFKKAENDLFFLVLKRQPDDALHPGIWQIVTGTLEDGESAVVGAYREVYEETKLKINRFWVVPLVDVFYSPSRDSVFAAPFFAGEVEPESEPILSNEHTEYKWVGFEEIAQLIPWPNQIQCARIIQDYFKSKMDKPTLIKIDV